ncbi:MAG: hypothetical protein M1834_001056 [Cirrosporium novae-zelandiae]|nr:MAG: hypothetical protein M1834_001056 [Cirrosporium novae-zelandiae]
MSNPQARSSFSRICPRFLTAISSIYGPLPPKSPSTWTPPPLPSGHRGRYLWTDAFAVLDFLTLSKETSSPVYITLAARLISTVHDVLGRTRDGFARLPNATDDQPLLGGLRIGKLDEHGSDGDGQYFHYLAIWMFALNRMALASGDISYNSQAISLAKAVHPRFMKDPSAKRPRLYWKMSMDLSEPLVFSEGNLDPIDGYVVFSILQAVAGQNGILANEIASYKRILDTKWPNYSSSDPLDLGMTLWTAHWFLGKEEWADSLCKRALASTSMSRSYPPYLKPLQGWEYLISNLFLLDELVNEFHFFSRPPRRRLAFREFGTCLGIRSILQSQPTSFNSEEQGNGLETLASDIVTTWETEKVVPDVLSHENKQKDGLEDITAVMYAAALWPGALQRSYFNDASSSTVATAAT